MKTITKTLFTFAALWGAQAQAIPADHFSCTTEVVIYEGAVRAKNTQDFFMARLPQAYRPSPEVLMTKAETTMETEADNGSIQIYAHPSISYAHAVKLDDSSNVIDAAQESCLNFGYSFCLDDYACSSTMEACLQGPSDPFDERWGWEKTDFSESGLPVLDTEFLLSRREVISAGGEKLGEVSIECEHKGSYE